MAAISMGYPFAYQALGSIYFEKINSGSVKNFEFEYMSELIKYNYAKVWNELSERDKDVIFALVLLGADSKSVKRENVMKALSERGVQMKSSSFNT